MDESPFAAVPLPAHKRGMGWQLKCGKPGHVLSQLAENFYELLCFK